MPNQGSRASYTHSYDLLPTHIDGRAPRGGRGVSPGPRARPFIGRGVRRLSFGSNRGNWNFRESLNRFVICVFILSTIVTLIYLPMLYTKAMKPITFVWPENMTRAAYELIRINESSTLIQPAKVCVQNEAADKDAAPTLLLVIVCSAARNFEQRNAVRNSWAQKDLTPQNVKVIFLVGHSANFSGQARINKEAVDHGDLLQESFLDTYANLTLKSLMALKWFAGNCDSVPYLLKMDDDVYVHLPKLRDLVAANKKPNHLVGSLICGAAPIRDPYNKWYAPNYMFKEKVYPNYLSGTAYLMSRSTALVLLEAAAEVPIFHLEDIFVTGLLSRTVEIRPEDHRGFSYAKRVLNPCLYSQIISSHHLSMPEMRGMASKLLNFNRKAPSAGHRRPTCRTLRPSQLRTYSAGKCKWPKSH